MRINATFLRNALTLGPTVRAHVVPRLFQEFRQQLLVRIRHLKTLTYDDAHTPWTNAAPPFSDSLIRHDISISREKTERCHGPLLGDPWKRYSLCGH